MTSTDITRYALIVFAGALICNSIPHLVSGLRGERFQTPFARFRGKLDSAPLTNFVWGAVNLLTGAVIATRRILGQGLDPLVWPLILGFTASGALLSWYFGRRRSQT